MAGRLTTHVLDLVHGRPAAGVVIQLWSIDRSGERALLNTVTTNTDGRTDAPLLSGEALRAGCYELLFLVGDYFAAQPDAPVSPLFLDRVPVQFIIGDPSQHYHVPLLTTPWAYSTYRGS